MKKINGDKIIQIVILSLTVILLVSGLCSGKINQYVHPRFNLGLWLSIFILFLFVISIVTEQKKGGHNVGYFKYMVYIIPLVIAVILQPGVMSKTDVVLAGSTSSPTQATPAVQNKEEESVQNTENANPYTDVIDYLQDTANEQQTASVTPEAKRESKATDANKAYRRDVVDGYYVIKDDIYADWFMEVYDHPEDFVGEKYQFLAQVFSMAELKSTQFLAGRNFMVCCAADLVGYGFICESDNRAQLKENQWILVKATISLGEYQGSQVPVLVDCVIQKAKQPKEKYVYYNYY